MVSCAECGSSYDSDEQAFCPRCGSTRASPEQLSAGALASASRSDPRARRVRMAGVILVSLATVSLLVSLAGLWQAPNVLSQNAPDILSDVPGGELQLHILEGGRPADAWVRLTDLNGTLIEQGATDSGWFNSTMPTAAGIIDVGRGQENWTRHVVTIQSVPTQVELDLATAEPESDDWLGLDALIKTMRILLGVFAVIQALMLAAGIQALRLRTRNFAILGASTGLLPVLLLLVAQVLVGFVLLAILLTAAIIFLVQGRDQFRD